jgi:hypothetical protein
MLWEVGKDQLFGVGNKIVISFPSCKRTYPIFAGQAVDQLGKIPRLGSATPYCVERLVHCSTCYIACIWSGNLGAGGVLSGSLVYAQY